MFWCIHMHAYTAALHILYIPCRNSHRSITRTADSEGKYVVLALDKMKARVQQAYQPNHWFSESGQHWAAATRIGAGGERHWKPCGYPWAPIHGEGGGNLVGLSCFILCYIQPVCWGNWGSGEYWIKDDDRNCWWSLPKQEVLPHAPRSFWKQCLQWHHIQGYQYIRSRELGKSTSWVMSLIWWEKSRFGGTRLMQVRLCPGVY